MNAMIVGRVEYRLYNRNYAVSADGAVLKMATLTAPPIKSSDQGYLYVGARIMIHRMVATCWLPKPPAGANDVHHVNEIRTDNRDANLQWLTRQEHLAIHPDRARFERTPEIRKKMSDAMLGREISQEARQKLRLNRLGRKSSEETKEKQRVASLRLGLRPPVRPKGFKVPEEQCQAQSESHWRNTTCKIDGVVYRSFAEAGRALGIRLHTLRKRCMSPNFGDYELVER